MDYWSFWIPGEWMDDWNSTGTSGGMLLSDGCLVPLKEALGPSKCGGCGSDKVSGSPVRYSTFGQCWERDIKCPTCMTLTINRSELD